MEPHDLPPAPVTQSDPSPPGPAAVTDPTAAAASDVPTRDPRYPLTVIYCPICSLPPELHEYHSKNQFEKCSDWLRKHTPTLFPDRFPEEAAAATAAEASDAPPPSELSEDKSVKVAVPIEQKTSGGKKKKAPAEVVLMLGQRKGKKQVTIVYGLDLFGVKLKDATKAAKRKFATGSSLAISPDNREVIEIQGSRQEDMAELTHKEWGVPREAIYIVNAQKKKVRAFP